ncbi:hypothetical protein D3C75_1250340 [compost metagenome]
MGEPGEPDDFCLGGFTGVRQARYQLPLQAGHFAFAQRLHRLASSSICWQKRRRLPNGSHTCICRPQSRRSASGRA